MENIINFASNNFVWLLTFTIILLFALVGYIYDSKKNKDDLLRKKEEELNEEALNNIVIPEGKSLAETVNVSKNINPETKAVELTDQTILNQNQDNENNN